MNLSPLPIQKFFDNAGRPLNGGLLFTYVSGTTTKLATYQDQAGTPNTNPVVLNFRGEANVWLDQTLTYKFVLAPANDTDPPTAPIWSADNISAAVTYASLTQQILGQILYPRTPAEIAALVVPTFYIFPPGDVRRYGADATGAVSADAAFTSALAQAAQTNGAEITFPGTYLITTGIVVTADGIQMRGSGIAESILKAGANSINVLKIGASSCVVHGGFLIDGNSRTNIHGLVLAPSNEAGGPIVKINNNTIGPVKIKGCTEGCRMRTGVTAFDQLYFNSLISIEVVDCVRSLWMQANGTTCNRNYFYNFRGGSTTTVCNTGCQIDAGSGNKFYALEMEGILNGVTPNATPIGLLIGATSANDGNIFFGAQTEACTVGCENKNALSEFYGCSIFGTTGFIYTAKPLVFMGGYTASALAQITEAYIYQNNNQIAGRTNGAIALQAGCSGMQFNAVQVSSSDVNTLDDYKEGTWTPVLAGAGTAGVQTYNTQLGKYTKSGRVVTASGTILLSAKGGTMAGSVTITGLPYAAVTGAGNSHGMTAGFGNITFPAGYTQLGLYLAGSTATINVVRSGSASAFANVDSAEISNTSYIEFTMQYQAAT